jgi:predicted alpha/beta hydrolase
VVFIEKLQIATPLGYKISVTKFSSEIPIEKSIVISSATGVLQKFYAKFAKHFAAIGYTCYTFDYHGIGGSSSGIKALKKNSLTLKDWAENDQSSVVKFAKDKQPNYPITLVAHSLGGQLLAFNTHAHLIDNVITIASQSGYYKHWVGIDRYKMYAYWNLLIPPTTSLFGYFPTKKLGLFENLPKQATLQWRRWANHSNYMLGEFNRDSTNFDTLTCPMLILSFPRDFYAPKPSVDWLASQFSKANIDRRHIIPEELGIPDVKHFGFFRNIYKDSLWEMTHDWIKEKPVRF